MTATKWWCCGPRTPCIASTPRLRARRFAKWRTGPADGFSARRTAARHHPGDACRDHRQSQQPHGTGMQLQGIETILKRARKAAVLIDEAYYEFCGVTALPLVERVPNLFVSRTFSKVYRHGGHAAGLPVFKSGQHRVSAQSPVAIQRQYRGGARRTGGGSRSRLHRKVRRRSAGRARAAVRWSGKARHCVCTQLGEFRAGRISENAPSKYGTRCAGVAFWCATAVTKHPVTCA